MDRTILNEDHHAFREMAAEFAAREVVPRLEKWESDRLIGRDAWEAAGNQGLLGLNVPVRDGGIIDGDYRYRAVLIEELAKVHATSLAAGFALQDDIAMPYVIELGTDEQRARWLPGMARGTLIGAVAMTEPGTGSDLRGIRTSARQVDGGWLVNGSKTFITNGVQADLVVTVVNTGGAGSELSLLVVEEGMPGFTRGRKLDKVGLHAQDTAELFFDDVLVPDQNLLGTIGGGLHQLKTMLPLERLGIAAQAVAQAEVILAETIRYTHDRRAFGSRISDFQNTRFELAEMDTEVSIARTYLDQAVLAYNAGRFSATDAARAKWWTTDLQNRVIDRCLQLHGGYGFMTEYAVGRAFQDARVQRIYGGTNEVMKHIIAREICHQ